MKKLCTVFLLIVALVCGYSIVSAQVPQNGDVACGVIQGDVLYSNTGGYPNGTPVINGNCSWQPLYISCGKMKIKGKGKNHNAFQYEYTCLNVPLDDYVIYILLLPLAYIAYRALKNKHALCP